MVASEKEDDRKARDKYDQERESRDRIKERERERERERGRNYHDDRKKESHSSNSRGREDSKLIPGVNVIATCSEENGEISCSVEETNRIRALLGLKPLTEKKPNDETQAVENFKLKQAQEAKEYEQEDIKLRLEKAKLKRLDNQKLQGTHLGDVAESEDLSLLSAAEWVKRSRKKELNDKEKAKMEAEKASLRFQEQEEEELRLKTNYSSEQLKGLAVKHSVKDFEAGQEIILTLADSNILEVDERGRTIDINEEADILENVNMADNEKVLEREKRAKRAKQALYTAYDDEEFAEGAKVGSKRSILSQYDEENWTGKNNSGPKFVIGESSSLDPTDATSSSSMEVGRIAESLKVESKDMSSYYTSSEYASVNFKVKNKKDKKKRKVRSKETFEEDDEENKMEVSNSIETNNLDENIEKNNDRGSRSNFVSKDKMIDIENSRRQAYDLAVKKAENKAAKLISIEDGDDAEIALSLARARRVATLQRKQEEDYDDAAAKEVLKSIIPKQTIVKSENQEDDLENAVGADGYRPDGTLVFTNTTEFTTRLQARLNEKARSIAEIAVKEQETNESISSKSHHNSNKVSWGANSVSEAKSKDVDTDDEDARYKNNDDNMEEEEEDDDDDDDEEEDLDHIDLVHNQPIKGRGMAATLALLKGSKDLERKEEIIGRTKDAKTNIDYSQYITPREDAKDIKIEYRDSLGRKLTPKEAYRQMCYDFHGYGTSKKKTEKRLRAMEAKEKAKTTSLTEVGTLRSFTMAQEATGRAHITIGGGNIASGSSTSEMARQMAKKKAKAEANKLKKSQK